MTPPDVAEQYGIPLRTVQSACVNGLVKATKLRRMWLIDPADAAVYAEQWRPRHNGVNGVVHPE